MDKLVNVLFVCIGNTCRSQMAEGFARAHGGGVIDVRSCGTSAMGVVNGASIDAMAEVGIDISNQTSDQWTGEMAEWAHVVVTLGCCSADELCPINYGGRKEDWPIADPLGRTPDVMASVRDDIEERVKRLIEECREVKGE